MKVISLALCGLFLCVAMLDAGCGSGRGLFARAAERRMDRLERCVGRRMGGGCSSAATVTATRTVTVQRSWGVGSCVTGQCEMIPAPAKKLEPAK